MEGGGMILTGENGELVEKLSQCHFVHHKSHMD
jgi:Zn-finger protein